MRFLMVATTKHSASEDSRVLLDCLGRSDVSDTKVPSDRLTRVLCQHPSPSIGAPVHSWHHIRPPDACLAQPGCTNERQCQAGLRRLTSNKSQGQTAHIRPGEMSRLHHGKAVEANGGHG